MQSNKQTQANRTIRRITHTSLGVNAGLCGLKIVVGRLSGSMALVADGVHSLSDMMTDFAVLLGNRLGAKAPDQKHPYGHGRIETFATGFIALILIVVGGGMFYGAALAIARAQTVEPRPIILAVALVSVLAKELLYRVTLKVAKQTRSSALYANAWHHRSDALSSVAVVFGYTALRWGFRYGDQLATIAVGLMIILVGVRILGKCFDELAEGAVDHDIVELIKEIINANPAIHDWHKLRSRSVGREIFLDLHILVAPDLSIAEAHDIAEALENTIEKRLTCPVNITIHMEPDLPEMRE
ncbi:cation diffusion facilitator family transporter [Planctomycetota bacterium]